MGKFLNMCIGMIIFLKFFYLLNVFYFLFKIVWCVVEYGYYELVVSVVVYFGNGGFVGGVLVFEMNIFV